MSLVWEGHSGMGFALHLKSKFYISDHGPQASRVEPWETPHIALYHFHYSTALVSIWAFKSGSHISKTSQVLSLITSLQSTTISPSSKQSVESLHLICRISQTSWTSLRTCLLLPAPIISALSSQLWISNLCSSIYTSTAATKTGQSVMRPSSSRRYSASETRSSEIKGRSILGVELKIRRWKSINAPVL